MRVLWFLIWIVVPVICGAQEGAQLSINNYFDSATALRKSNPVHARAELKKAIALSSINAHYRFGQLNYLLGDFFLDVSEFDSAYYYFQEATPHLTVDDPTLGRVYFGKSYVEYYHSQYEKSMASAIQAEKIARQLNDKPGLARAVKMIGSMYELENKVELSLQYFRESLTISEELKDTLNIVRALNSIGTPYTTVDKFEESRQTLLKAVELGKAINCQKCLAISYSQLGVNDFYWKKYDRSIEYYKLEQKINKQLGEDFNYFYPYQNIAESFVEMNKITEALIYNDSALQVAHTHRVNQYLHDAYKVRYAIHKKAGNTALALEAFEKQIEYKDSIFSAEKNSISQNLMVEFETEKREQKIKELEQQQQIAELEATTARQWQVGLILFLILLSVVIAVMYNRYQLKKRTARALDEKNLELQKLNGFKDRMFAVISHDLRNPVDAFNTIMESLNQNLEHASREELKEFLESTLASAKDLKSLLNNLLEWSLVQIGKLPFNPKPVSLKEVVNESLSHTDSMASVKNICISNQVDSHLVMADKAMVTIIVRNLISNAIKFSGEAKNIQLTSTRQNGTLVLAVKDEGIGMKSEDVARLFRQEENARSIGSSSAKGAGIGLLLCKELTEKNSGKIYAESEEGKGSTFYLELPAV